MVGRESLFRVLETTFRPINMLFVYYLWRCLLKISHLIFLTLFIQLTEILFSTEYLTDKLTFTIHNV